MRDVAKIEHTENIRAGLPVMKKLYGLTMDEYDYLDTALDALRDIKHFAILPMVSYIKVDSEGYAALPCNMGTIDSVGVSSFIQSSFKDRIVVDSPDIDTDGYQMASAIRSALSWPVKMQRSIDSVISYIIEDERIFITDRTFRDTEIGIAYSGYVVDDEGYPKITRKQANAIAVINAKNILMAAALRGDKAKAAMLQMVTQEAHRLKQAASIPEDITDNEIDEIMNAQTTFNRKAYRRPNRYSR